MSDTTELPVTGWRRWLYTGLGMFFVGLAALGAVLPILPTTPFLLLASFFFSRSSPTLRAWLFRLPVWGSLLRDWQRHRAVRPRTKVAAIVFISAAIISSAALTTLSWLWIVVLLLVGTFGLVVVWRLPVVQSQPINGPHFLSFSRTIGKFRFGDVIEVVESTPSPLPEV